MMRERGMVSEWCMMWWRLAAASVVVVVVVVEIRCFEREKEKGLGGAEQRKAWGMGGSSIIVSPAVSP